MKSINFLKKSVLLVSFLLVGSMLFALPNSKKNKPNIVCTIFPEYDWTKEIIGENLSDFNVSFIVNNGVDLHSYQPSVSDGMKISTADVFMYIGGHSDNWVTDFLEATDNKDLHVINLMNVLENSLQFSEIKEGMEHHHHECTDEHCSHEHHHHECENHDSHECNHNHHHEHHHHENETEECHNKHSCKGHEYDEHIWLSLKNAKECCKEITRVLVLQFPSYKESFNTNLNNYLKKLDDLDKQYKNVVEKSKQDTLIFCDRFPFRYLIADYGLNYYAAFSGCSAESEASFETVKFLSDKLNQIGLNTVVTIENSDNKLAKTVIKNAKKPKTEILVLDSMQATTERMAKKGESYIKIMDRNLNTLKEALK